MIRVNAGVYIKEPKNHWEKSNERLRRTVLELDDGLPGNKRLNAENINPKEFTLPALADKHDDKTSCTPYYDVHGPHTRVPRANVCTDSCVINNNIVHV